MAISMDDIKCRKSKQYPGDPYHVITVAGTPVENIQKHTRRGRTWYESDTFSASYNTITEAKEKTFERCEAGYYGPALSADTTGEKEPETMIIEPGSKLDKRAEANETANITEMRLENGQLPAYAFPGGYPLFYLDKENNVLCPKCANENDEFSAPLVAADINYEDAQLYCDQCSKRIESAYAEDEAEGENS